MNVTAKKRAGKTKATVKQIRRKGNIPAVFYALGEPGVPIEVDGNAFKTIMRTVKPGRLSTTIFTLDIEGKQLQAIIKEIQYNITSYDVMHLDFEKLEENVPVTVDVPIECVGIVDCAGIKAGGFLRQVIRSTKVKCLPKHIPEEFFLDICELKVRQSKRLSDIQMPEGVKPVTTTDEVVVVIAKH